jgi:hypothetical protein
MVSSGEDTYSGGSSDDKLVAQDDTQDNEEEGHKVEEHQSARKRRSRSQSPSRAVMPADLPVIAQMPKIIPKRLACHDIDVNCSLCIVAAALKLQKG